MEELDHQASKPLECARDSHGWADLYKHILCGLDVDLELARFIDRRVQQGEKALYSCYPCQFAQCDKIHAPGVLYLVWPH